MAKLLIKSVKMVVACLACYVMYTIIVVIYLAWFYPKSYTNSNDIRLYSFWALPNAIYLINTGQDADLYNYFLVPDKGYSTRLISASNSCTFYISQTDKGSSLGARVDGKCELPLELRQWLDESSKILISFHQEMLKFYLLIIFISGFMLFCVLLVFHIVREHKKACQQLHEPDPKT